ADSAYFYRQIQILEADSAFASAATMAKRAVQKYPRHLTFRLLEAQNERRAGHPGEARATLDGALVVDRQSAPVHFQLAQLLAEEDSVAGAIRHARAAAASDATYASRSAGLLAALGRARYTSAASSKRAADFSAALPPL